LRCYFPPAGLSRTAYRYRSARPRRWRSRVQLRLGTIVKGNANSVRA